MGSAFSLIVDVRAMTMRRWNLVLFRIMRWWAWPRSPCCPSARAPSTGSLLLFLYLGGPVACPGFVGVFLMNRITGGTPPLGARSPPPPAPPPATPASTTSPRWPTRRPTSPCRSSCSSNVDSATNGSFYVAWGIVAIAFYVPSAIGQALLAEGGKDGAHVRTQMRLAMTAGGGPHGPRHRGHVPGQGGGGGGLRRDYRDAAHILPAMMLAGIPWAITLAAAHRGPGAAPQRGHRDHHRHPHRVDHRARPSCWCPRHGLDGASRAWLVGNVVAAVVAVVTAVGRRTSAGQLAAAGLDGPLLPAATDQPGSAAGGAHRPGRSAARRRRRRSIDQLSRSCSRLTSEPAASSADTRARLSGGNTSPRDAWYSGRRHLQRCAARVWQSLVAGLAPRCRGPTLYRDHHQQTHHEHRPPAGAPTRVNPCCCRRRLMSHRPMQKAHRPRAPLASGARASRRYRTPGEPPPRRTRAGRHPPPRPTPASRMVAW
jgi:hypothetical protein